ncbi:hypothetical protein EYC80_004741 [Monilinia laxa]|uniref:Uncharacterized protein n=1 Tax=Monilinia laxa TaxID=61186 RepID=A0A5N6KI71_MONLA|nr:hypothetical protein EYC80_004741 [Monilinia laxa]
MFINLSTFAASAAGRRVLSSKQARNPTGRDVKTLKLETKGRSGPGISKDIRRLTTQMAQCYATPTLASNWRQQ